MFVVKIILRFYGDHGSSIYANRHSLSLWFETFVQCNWWVTSTPCQQNVIAKNKAQILTLSCFTFIFLHLHHYKADTVFVKDDNILQQGKDFCTDSEIWIENYKLHAFLIGHAARMIHLSWVPQSYIFTWFFWTIWSPQKCLKCLWLPL